MTTKERGLLVIFAGPSGVGKGTIVKPFIERHPEVRLSVSATTRAPRPGEVDGVNYHFVSEEQFKAMFNENRLLENAEYSGNHYGTPIEPVEELLDQGFDVLLEIEVQGAQQVRRRCPYAISVFVMPPSFDELEKRLRGRNTETPEVIEQRLRIARGEIGLAYDYDFILLNDDIEEAVEQLGLILKAARCTPKYLREFIDEVNRHA